MGLRAMRRWLQTVSFLVFPLTVNFVFPRGLSFPGSGFSALCLAGKVNILMLELPPALRSNVLLFNTCANRRLASQLRLSSTKKGGQGRAAKG